MQTSFKRFLANEQGATAIEYALIASFISITIVTAATQIGSKVSATFTTANNAMP
jgi:pilus assembly protein Flp/PilA